jgi:hypothetical protein
MPSKRVKLMLALMGLYGLAALIYLGWTNAGFPR